MLDEERWADVEGFPGYQVSDRGRVGSFWKREAVRIVGGMRWVIGTERRILQWKPHKSGYVAVGLARNGDQVFKLVHLLVLEHFVGPKPLGMFGLHRDDVKTNNHVSNLYWGTLSQNQRDSIRNGHHVAKRGEDHFNAKLTESIAREVCRRAIAGESGLALAAEFDIDPSRVSKIKLGKLWGSVTADIRG